MSSHRGSVGPRRGAADLDRRDAVGGGRRGHPRPGSLARDGARLAGEAGLPQPVDPRRRRRQRRGPHAPDRGGRCRGRTCGAWRPHAGTALRPTGPSRWSRARPSTCTATTTWRSIRRPCGSWSRRRTAPTPASWARSWSAGPTRSACCRSGWASTSSGCPPPCAERGELDQEQHDAVRDVFAVPGGLHAGPLGPVRRARWLRRGDDVPRRGRRPLLAGAPGRRPRAGRARCPGAPPRGARRAAPATTGAGCRPGTGCAWSSPTTAPSTRWRSCSSSCC